MILRAAALLFILLLPPAGFAQSLPALYDVSDVSADDVLNVRQTPSVDSEVIGTLQPDATSIEVVAFDENQNWARLNLGEVSGWASLSFLKRQPYQLGGRPPETATCFGTEPFWSLSIAPDSATFSSPDALDLTFSKTQSLRSRNRLDRHMAVYENDLGGLVSTLKATQCSDGMSDRVFGWELDLMLFVAGNDNAQMFSGCCSISAD